MLAPLNLLLRSVVRHGELTVIDAAGTPYHFGPANDAGPTAAASPGQEARPLVVRITDRATEIAIARDPYLEFGEAYMDGRLVMVEGGIYDLLELVMRGVEGAHLPRWVSSLENLRRGTRRFRQLNSEDRSRRNVAHHYDIDASIYELFLDEDLQYSCAYFAEPGMSLEQAQLLKKRHIAAKLALEPGQRVLDIGSGWGGLSLYLARTCGVDVTGITLSGEQLAFSRQRAARAGLSRTVNFESVDYRSIGGSFDRIVSVGMFEHVGVNHFRTYFDRIRALLDDRGVALVHTIGRSDGPGYTNPFIERYIFPGGYFPALSEILPAIERAGLIATDIEVLRLHYAETLRAWRERFMARRGEAVALRGEAFARMWEFYLAASEAGFRHQGLVVFQLQLVRRIDALPLTRDYIQEAEQRLASLDTGASTPRRMAGE